MFRIFVALSLVFVLAVQVLAAEPPVEAKPPQVTAVSETPLDQPNMDHAALVSWVTLAVLDTLTFSYGDYQQRLQQSSRYFTMHGWINFLGALQRSRFIDTVTAGHLKVTAQPKSPPVVLHEGSLGGKYRWVISMPLVVSYKKGSRQDALALILVVDRVAVAESPQGVGIARLIEEDSAPSSSPIIQFRETGASAHDEFDYPLKEFGGIGVQHMEKKGALQVLEVFEGFPAHRAGVKVSDRLVEIDGKPTRGMQHSDSVNLIRGVPGTKINLAYEREGTKRPIKFHLVRAAMSEKTLWNNRWYCGHVIESLQSSAKKGSAVAQNHLGVLYESCLGVKRDYIQAAKWYRKAAEQGDPKAQYNLAMLYLKGSGVKRSKDEAFKWVRKAAEQNNDRAQYNLSKFFADGTGVTQDYASAYFWAYLLGEYCHSSAYCLDAMRLAGDFKAHLTSEEISAQDIAVKERLLKGNPAQAAFKSSRPSAMQDLLSDMPLDQPNMDKGALIAWAAAAATRVTTFGYADYEAVFSRARNDFSPDGWKAYQAALVESGLLKNVKKYDQVVVSIPIMRPVIEKEWAEGGVYRWLVRVTMLQTIRAGSKKVTRYLPLHMIIIRTPAAQNPFGIGINSWIEVA